MYISSRLPKSLLYDYGVKAAHQTISRATYSICTVSRCDTNNRWPLNRTPIALIAKRNKSFTAIATDIQSTMSHSDTVALIQNATISYHDFTGLPWWASIITYTIGLRLLTVPLQVYTQKIHARLDLIATNELPAVSEKVLREANAARIQLRLTERAARVHYMVGYKREFQKLIVRDNCHPVKTTIVAWMQIPLWISQTVAFRNMVQLKPDPGSTKAMITLTQLSVGGLLWIPNLVETDVSYILPVWLGLINLANIELMTLERPNKRSRLMLVATAFFRSLSALSVVICASVPSCLALYWCTSSTLAFLQNLFLLSPRVKRTFGIPTNTSYHMERPYRTIVQRFGERMGQRKAWWLRVVFRRKPKK